MELITKAPKGTVDIVPGKSEKWQVVEDVFRSEAELNGFGEVRTPVFEHTELFQRGVGDTTDVVEKQMYTFEDKGGRSITLRPEGTAGAVRAMLENGLYNAGYPVKLYYLTSCYRYEKPQAGRLRELHQFGVEMFGAAEPVADAQIIAMALSAFKRLGLEDVGLQLNSIGCPECRKEYHKALKEYFTARKEQLCDTCLSRLERNPMRILDCKSPVCSALAAEAPVILDYLCDDCAAHFQAVKGCLEEAELPYTVDPRIVRGLDYYTRTVFEFVSDALGAQAVVCGGGRYDGLCQELGGPSIPSLGFGMGLERLLLVMEAKGCAFPAPPRCELYLAPMGEAAVRRCFAIASRLREGGVAVEFDVAGRGLKAQMKYADKLGARYVIVVGDSELETGMAKLKDMESGEASDIALDDSLYTTLYNKFLDRQLAGMADLLGGELLNGLEK